MPRKYFRKYLPDHATVREHRLLRPFQALLKHPNLWHLNRHSVAGGLAAGLFGGLAPGPVQMGIAAILAIVFRVNLPVAVITTLYTNPLTWPPLILVAYGIGSWVTGGNGVGYQEFAFDWHSQPWSEFPAAFGQWLLGLGETFLIGDLILACLLAVLGYAGVQLAWRLYIMAYLRRRRRRRNP
jgi:uncharacterized protein (DUF2062 family)